MGVYLGRRVSSKVFSGPYRGATVGRIRKKCAKFKNDTNFLYYHGKYGEAGTAPDAGGGEV